jgi:hypothetical protein
MAVLLCKSERAMAADKMAEKMAEKVAEGGRSDLIWQKTGQNPQAKPK